MVLYFVSKLKLISNKPNKKHIEKNKVSLLSYAFNDSEGWELVKREAKMYMTKKNEEMCDQTKNKGGENVKTMYVIRESNPHDDKIYTIEVYKQWQDKIKGYISSSYKDREIKVAEFSLTKYQGDVDCRYCETNNYIKEAPRKDLRVLANAINSGMNNPKLLQELRGHNKFLDRIKQVDKYSSRAQSLRCDDYDHCEESYESVESE